MTRSVCLFIVFAICNNARIDAQGTLPVKPNGFKISSTSPLSSLSSQQNTVTPASFLQSNQEKASGSDESIPSILTGKKSATPVTKPKPRATQDKIDPLNIPSSPIATLPKSSGFQPPSNFVPPKSVPSAGGSSKSGFQSKGGFQQRPNTTVNSSNTKSNPLIPPATGRTTQSNSLTPANSQNPRNQAVTGTNSNLSTQSRFNQPNNLSNQGQVSGNAGLQRPMRSQGTGALSSSSNLQSAPTVENRNALANPRVASALNNTRTATPRANNRLSEPTVFADQQLNPQLKVVAMGPKTISVNKTGKFDVKIVNIGQVDASDVMVGIEIPAWVEVIGQPNAAGGEASVKQLDNAKGIVWNLSYLPAGRDAVVSINLEPKENRAFNLKTEWTTAPVSGESKVMVTQANLQTRISGPSEVKYGEKAVYTITIENTGNGTAEKVSVSLSDSLGGDSAGVGEIVSGGTKQFEVELTAGQAGPLKLEAFVKGDAGVKSEIAKEIVVRRAKLVVNAVGPKFKYAGSAITYNLSIENQGDAPAKDIHAAALLPLSAEYISGLNQISENDGRKIGWKIPEIPAGSKRNFIITCLIQQAGDARMEIGVRSGDGLTSGDIVATKVEALADLKLEVVDPRGPQAVGREVTYELHIKNRGTKSARNVLVSGEFSDFIDPIGGSGAKARMEKAGMISFDPISEIKVGQSVVLKVVAKAYEPGTHTFRAIVQCKEQDIRKISEGTTKFFGESIKAPARKRTEVPVPTKAAATQTAPANTSIVPQAQAPQPTGFQPPANNFQPNR